MTITQSPRRAFLFYISCEPICFDSSKDSEFTITTGNCYLGGFIGEKDTRDRWNQGKSHISRTWSRSLPLWPIPTHSLPMPFCRSRYSSNGNLYREQSTELVKVSPTLT
jgi:hypothetical protein